MGTCPSWTCPPLPSGQHRQWLLTGAGVPRGGQTPPRCPAPVATEEPLPTPHRGGDLAFMALSSPLGDGVLAIGPRPHPPLGGDGFARRTAPPFVGQTQSPSNGGWGLGPMALTSSSWGEIGFARRTATPFVGQTPRGGGVLALMAKASSSMGDRRVDRPLACGVLTVPPVACDVWRFFIIFLFI